MKLSVVIPTYNGAYKIQNLLSTLEEQTFKDFEVIVVIDGSTDNTEEVIKSKSYSFPLKIIIQENKGRAGTRNAGVNNSCGNLLIFFDDDVRLSKQCLEEHFSHHEKHINTILVGGIYEDLALMKTDIQKYKAYLSVKWTGEIEQPDKPIQSIYLSAANLSLSTSLFKELGGFDERLRDVEDYDLGIKAYMKKIPVFVNSKALVWHDDFITIKSYLRRNREYNQANQILLNIKPEYRELHILPPPIKYRNLKKIFYFLFTFSALISLIDNNKLDFLPEKWRYKIYDYIIMAYSAYFPQKKI